MAGRRGIVSSRISDCGVSLMLDIRLPCESLPYCYLGQGVNPTSRSIVYCLLKRGGGGNFFFYFESQAPEYLR